MDAFEFETESPYPYCLAEYSLEKSGDWVLTGWVDKGDFYDENDQPNWNAESWFSAICQNKRKYGPEFWLIRSDWT